MLLVNAGAKLDVRNNRGWLPLTIADGVYYNARVMMNLHTAKLLRELMVARGLDASDKGANLGGALRDNLNVEDETRGAEPLGGAAQAHRTAAEEKRSVETRSQERRQDRARRCCGS